MTSIFFTRLLLISPIRFVSVFSGKRLEMSRAEKKIKKIIRRIIDQRKKFLGVKFSLNSNIFFPFLFLWFLWLSGCFCVGIKLSDDCPLGNLSTNRNYNSLMVVISTQNHALAHYPHHFFGFKICHENKLLSLQLLRFIPPGGFRKRNFLPPPLLPTF